MTREDAQDQAMKLSGEMRSLSDSIPDEAVFVITGKQFKALCNSMAITADSFARLVEKLDA